MPHQPHVPPHHATSAIPLHAATLDFHVTLPPHYATSQVCATFGDVSDADKIGAFGIQLDGKERAWYCALKPEEKDTCATLQKAFILEYSPSGPKWSLVNQLN